MSPDKLSNGKSTPENTSESDAAESVYTISLSNTITLPEKDYDPYLHRKVEHPTSFFETLMHLMKCSLGTGILAMPSAFSNAGYLIGIIGTLFIGLMCTHSVHVLISSEYELCKRKKKPSLTYQETAQAAVLEGPPQTKWMAKYAPSACDLFLIMYEIGTCSVYMIFVATNVKDVVDQYQAPENQFNVRYYCIFILPAFLIVQFITNYKHLAPLSTIAIFVSGVSLGIICYFLLNDLSETPVRYAVAPFEKIPIFFGTVMFAMEAIGVVFPLENEMKNPKKFNSICGVLNCAMVPICLMYTGVGLIGFLKYGEGVEPSITLSLPRDYIIAQAVRIMLSMSVFVSCTLFLQAVSDVVWDNYVKQIVKSHTNFWHYTVRFSGVILTFILAVAVPYLEQFIALIGALCLSTLGLTFPVIIETFTFWYKYKGIWFTLLLLKNAVICFMSTMGLVVGSYVSIEEMVEKINGNI